MSDNKTLCIVGLGLVGGSLAASLKAGAAPWRIRAVDRRRGALDYALASGLLDEGCDSLEEGVREADLVVLCGPVPAIRRQLGALAGLLRQGQVVTDVGAAKAGIVAEARRVLPAGVAFVGGHPVGGTERAGVESAVTGLFRGQPCVLTPEPETPREALELVTELWESVGAEMTFLDPETHDRVIAVVHQLPGLVAFALLATVGAEAPGSGAALAGGEMKDFSRLLRSSPEMWRDLWLENTGPLLQGLDALTARLADLRAAIAAGDGSAVVDLLARAADAREFTWTP